MNKKIILLFLVFFFLVSLSLYDYFSLQKLAQNAGPSLMPAINITDESPPQISWEIASATPKITDHTAIYWSGESSPSALTTSDSPAAVGYAHFTPDFIGAELTLPSKFTVNLAVENETTIYYRAYAKIDNLHFWTNERKIILK